MFLFPSDNLLNGLLKVFEGLNAAIEMLPEMSYKFRVVDATGSTEKLLLPFNPEALVIIDWLLC